MYNEGISKSGDLLDLAVNYEIIEKRGSHYNYGEERLGQGRETAKDYLRDHPEVAETVEQQIREKVLSQQPTAYAAEIDESLAFDAATAVELEAVDA